MEAPQFLSLQKIVKKLAAPFKASASLFPVLFLQIWSDSLSSRGSSEGLCWFTTGFTHSKNNIHYNHNNHDNEEEETGHIYMSLNTRGGNVIEALSSESLTKHIPGI